MRPAQLQAFLTFTVQHNMPVLVKGKPGVGKSDIVKSVAEKTGAELIVSHPVVSDPTDYKGLPFAVGNNEAVFLPFGDLKKLIDAKTKTIYFLDDLGQASPAVQAAVMQLLLARQINGHKISDKVVFIAATNRREDKAGVQGLLEPVKSRFVSIVELEVSTEDWLKWAVPAGMPASLLAFIKFRPNLLENFQASKDIVNSPCPRTVAAVGMLIKNKIPDNLEYEAIKGAAGEAFAAEYSGFLRTFYALPDIDWILKRPEKEDVPEDPAVLYALAGALAFRINKDNIRAAFTYINRLPGEIAVTTVRLAILRAGSEISGSPDFAKFLMKNKDVLVD